MNPHVRGALFIVFAMLLFSTQGVILRVFDLDVLAALAWVALFVLPFLLLIADRRAPPRPYGLLALHLGVFTINMATTLLALVLTTFAKAMLTHYIAPIIAFVIAVVVLGERFTWSSLIAIAASTLGMIVLLQPQGGVDFGSVLGLISGVAYGVLIITTKRLVRDTSVRTLLVYQNIALLLVFSFALWPLPAPMQWVGIALLALVTGVGAPLLYIMGMRTVQAQHIGIIAYAEIVFTVLFGALFFTELPPPATWLGGALIIGAGVYIIWLESKRLERVE